MASQSTIAHYRITSKLGEGGMGAVYRAVDSKLNREVAIKVLPESFASDPDRLARFTREAHVLASLNHPNIAAIYGVEERALVMELVDGETLAGPLPVEAALPLIHHLIDALEYAHDKGIVHRDLKPANLKITPEGRLKVLDFGLAKAMTTEEPPANPAVSPTITMRATMAGQLMGTAAYMAPEQARGQVVDKRADIWAFGVVVYELLTGRPLFDADNISDILVQVLSKEVDLSAVPLRFHALLRRCLERHPRKRLRDIGDARALLDEPVIAAVAPPSRTAWLPWSVAAAALLAMCVVGAMTWIWPRRAPRAQLFHFTFDGPTGAAISPDGRWLATAPVPGTNDVLRVRRMDDITWRTLAGTEGAELPFWAEDSSTLGFFSEGRLRTISSDGSNLKNVAAASEPNGGAWRGGSAGTILFASGDSLHVLNLQTGQERTIRTNAGNRISRPTFLPEGDRFVYLSGYTAPRLLQSSLSSQGEPREFGLETQRNVAFGRDPVPLVTQDVTPDGRSLIVLRPGPPGAILRIDLTASDSRRKPEVLSDATPISSARFSRDGRWLWISNPSADIAVLPYPPNRQTPNRASSSDGTRFPFLSQDGTRFYQFTDSALHSQPILPGMRLGERATLFRVVTPSRASSNFAAETRDRHFLIVSTDAVEELQTHILSDWTTLVKQ